MLTLLGSPMQLLRSVDRASAKFNSVAAELPSGGVGAHMVEAIIGLGERLGVAVMAEGVETIEQVDALRAVGCREAQGFLFGHPTSADDLPLTRELEPNA